jgi:hypothetical protein
MKRYEDYSKDDLMELLESLTPGGGEFYRDPETCVQFVRGRYANSVHLAKGRRAMADALRRISDKSEDWQKSTAKSENREYPWWDMGDIANAALRQTDGE